MAGPGVVSSRCIKTWMTWNKYTHILFLLDGGQKEMCTDPPGSLRGWTALAQEGRHPHTKGPAPVHPHSQKDTESQYLIRPFLTRFK